MEAWLKVTTEYNSSISWPGAISEKTARDYYKATLKKHRVAATKSSRASGVHEEVTELTHILDSAVELEDSLQTAAEDLDKKKNIQVGLRQLPS